MTRSTLITDQELARIVRRADPLTSGGPVSPTDPQATWRRVVAIASGPVTPDANARHGRPQRWRPSKRIALRGVGVLAVAALALAVGLIGGTGGGTSNAFADWSASPTAPAAGQLQAAESSCAGAEPQLAGLAPTVVDARGPFTMLVYVESTRVMDCITGLPGSQTPLSLGSGSIEPEEPAVVPGTIRPRDGSVGQGAEGHGLASFTDGQVGPEVTAVTLTLTNGTSVQATVANGWFAAWWPGIQDVQAAQVTTPTATTTQTLHRPMGDLLTRLAERHPQSQLAQSLREESQSSSANNHTSSEAHAR